MTSNISIYFDKRKIVLISFLCDYFKHYDGLLIEHNEFDDLSKVIDFFQRSTINRLFIYSNNIESLFTSLANHFKLIDAAGGVVRNTDGQVLLIKRNGIWDLPKGKVDDGELISDAALREVQEECSIAPMELGDLLTTTYHTYKLDEQDILKRTAWYSMLYKGNQLPVPQEVEQITEAKWVDQLQVAGFMQNTYESIKDVLFKAGLFNPNY